MKRIYMIRVFVSGFFTCFLCMLFMGRIDGQQSIEWQKSIGTSYSDDAMKLFTDDEGNLVIIGNEVHEDFTGNLRNYMVASKYDLHGQEIWKKYHDVAFETFSVPVDYYFGKHFFIEENGQKFISIVVHIAGRRILYKISDDNGGYYSYTELYSDVYTTDRNSVQVYANLQCSFQQSCYGPDSLIVQKVNPFPIIGFDPVVWTYALKQNIRTAPIQGHYDFNNQDITTDTAGNVYLLTQIERWDFQFCTDCGDFFIDAWSEIFKFDTSGQLVKHVKLKTAKAVVTNMRFIPNDAGKIVVRIDDINAAGTAIYSALYFLNDDLSLTKQFNLDRQYATIILDHDLNIFTSTFIYDEADPEIKGFSDVLVSKFNSDGVFQWKSYYGGSGYDFPKGLVVTNDGGLAFFANTESTDFDVAENHGGQDMWLVKLGENATSLDQPDDLQYSVYPNPAFDNINFSTKGKAFDVTLFDLNGKEIWRKEIYPSVQQIYIGDLAPGSYIMHLICGEKVSFMKLVKL